MPILIDYFRSLPSGAQESFMRTLVNALSKLFARRLNGELGTSIESSIDVDGLLRDCFLKIVGGVNIVLDLCVRGANHDNRIEYNTYWILSDTWRDIVGIFGNSSSNLNVELYHPHNNPINGQDVLNINVWKRGSSHYRMDIRLPYDIRLANASMPMQMIIKDIQRLRVVGPGRCSLLYESAFGHTNPSDFQYCGGDITSSCSYNFNQHLRELCPAPSTITSAVSDLYSTTVRRVTAAISGSVADDVATSTSSYTDTAISTDSTERSSTTISSVANDTFKWISERTTETYNSSREDDGYNVNISKIIAIALGIIVFVGFFACIVNRFIEKRSRLRIGTRRDDSAAYTGLNIPIGTTAHPTICSEGGDNRICGARYSTSPSILSGTYDDINEAVVGQTTVYDDINEAEVGETVYDDIDEEAIDAIGNEYLTVIDRPHRDAGPSEYARSTTATASELNSGYLEPVTTDANSRKSVGSDYLRPTSVGSDYLRPTSGADLSLGSGAGAQAACPPTSLDSPEVIEFDSVYPHTIPDSVLYNANAGRGAEEARDSLHLA